MTQHRNQICHLMTHQFYAELVQHATCVPVFYDRSDDIVNDITFCSHPDVDVFAWGSGSDPKKKSKAGGQQSVRKKTAANPTSVHPTTSVLPTTESTTRVLHSVSELDPQLQVQNNCGEKLFDAVY